MGTRSINVKKLLAENDSNGLRYLDLQLCSSIDLKPL